MKKMFIISVEGRSWYSPIKYLPYFLHTGYYEFTDEMEVLSEVCDPDVSPETFGESAVKLASVSGVALGATLGFSLLEDVTPADKSADWQPIEGGSIGLTNHGAYMVFATTKKGKSSLFSIITKILDVPLIPMSEADYRCFTGVPGGLAAGLTKFLSSDQRIAAIDSFQMFANMGTTGDGGVGRFVIDLLIALNRACELQGKVLLASFSPVIMDERKILTSRLMVDAPTSGFIDLSESALEWSLSTMILTSITFNMAIRPNRRVRRLKLVRN